jgi:hypothetical protein
MIEVQQIEFSSSFMVHPGLWRKVSWIAKLSPGDDPETETITLANKVEEVLAKINSQPLKLHDIGSVLPVELVTKDSREDIIKKHLQTINECKTIRNLEMFANMVQRENEDVLYEAYHQKKKELSK